MEVIVMKNNTMKKLLTAALSLSLSLSLAACSGGSGSAASNGSGSGSGSSAPADGVYQVAIVRQLDHASMNEIRDAIIAQLDAREAELNVTIDYEDFNGNNDPSTLAQIGAQIIADGYDVIIPIGTTAAQQGQKKEPVLRDAPGPLPGFQLVQAHGQHTYKAHETEPHEIQGGVFHLRFLPPGLAFFLGLALAQPFLLTGFLASAPAALSFGRGAAFTPGFPAGAPGALSGRTRHSGP